MISKKIVLAIGVLAVATSVFTAVTLKISNDSKLAEQKFIEQMIPHHADAIAMSNVALEKAETQSVKTLASSIIAAQQKEITDMRSWYKSWYGKEVPHMIANEHSGHGMEGDSLATLQAAKDVDLEFVKQMITHHEAALVMAREILEIAKHTVIIDLADQILSTQQNEINQMKSLQESLVKYPSGSVGRNDLNIHCDSAGSC